MTNTAIRMIGMVFIVFASSAWAERPWPDTTYECQVKTASETRGLVTIQALSLKQAEQDVVGEMALTTLGGRELSVSVTECLEYGTARFADSSFQYWRDRLER